MEDIIDANQVTEVKQHVVLNDDAQECEDAMVPGVSLSEVSRDVSSVTTDNAHVCKICGFTTKFALVFARHAPSHYICSDGIIR